MLDDPLTVAVVEAIRSTPCSVRALARAAEVPHSTLTRIAAGDRAATLAVATAVASALDAWTVECAKLARRIRQAQGGGGS